MATKMFSLCPVRVCPPSKLGSPKFDGSLRMPNRGAKLRSFTFKMSRKDAIIGPFQRTRQWPVCPSRLKWQERFSSASLDPLMNEACTESPHASGFHGEVADANLEDASDESSNGASPLELNGQLLDGSELAALRSDPVRSRLIRKLSEANQYIRYLLREGQVRERTLERCKSQFSSLELELGVLANIAQEIAKDGGKPGTRKINGRYIHSHLACKLEDIQKSIMAQSRDIDDVRVREVEFFWNGMAEDVTVMGSFDGWSQGEAMSPESTGTFTQFSTKLKLRPGRYEIKFRVDGDWRISPDLPTVGDGLMMNNLLIIY